MKTTGDNRPSSHRCILSLRIGVVNTGGAGSYPTSIDRMPNSDTQYDGSGCYPSVVQLYGDDVEVVTTNATACGSASSIVSSYGALEFE
jgi:hypothetical protein